MRARIKETDLSVPEPLDDWLYYSRTEAGAQYPIYCRRRAAEGSAEEVVLDLNPLAEGQSYFRLGAYEVSPDHRLLAWSSDTCGAESFTLRIKDLATGKELGEPVGNLSASVVWANDSATLFYVGWTPHAVPAGSTATAWAMTGGRMRRSTSRPTRPSSSRSIARAAGRTSSWSRRATPHPRCGSPAPTGRRSRSAWWCRGVTASSTG